METDDHVLRQQALQLQRAAPSKKFGSSDSSLRRSHMERNSSRLKKSKNKKRKHKAPTMRRNSTSTNDVALAQPPLPPPPHVEESPLIDTSVVKLSENCPLQKTSFTDIEEEKRLRLIDLVMEHFDSERTKRRDQYILSKLCKKYNDYRSALRKSHYLKHKTNAERLANRPTDMSREDWRWLVKFWTTDKNFQNRSRQNKLNSSCLTLRHISGSKSYARHREEWEKEKGREPSRLEIFEITHNKKDEASASVFDAFERAKSQIENNDEIEQLSDETIYSQQFPQKRPGRMHGMGPIVKPSQLGLTNVSSTWLRQQEQQETIDKLKGKVSELQSKVSEMEEMKMQFSSMMTFMKELCTAQGMPIPNFPHMVGDSSSASTSFSDS